MKRPALSSASSRCMCCLCGLLLTACPSDDGGTSDGGTSDGGTSDGGTSDGGTSDGGTSDGGTSGGGSRDSCSNVWPVEDAGMTWQYGYTDVSYSGEWTQVSTGAVTHDGVDAYEITGEGWIESESYNQTWTQSTWFVCQSDGLHLLGSSFNYSGSSLDYDYDGWNETTYDEAPLVAPTTMGADSSWTADFSGITTSGSSTAADDTVTPFGYRQTIRVTGTDTVTVPAGTFDVFLVEYSSTKGTTTQELAEGVGAVVGDGFELVRFE